MTRNGLLDAPARWLLGAVVLAVPAQAGQDEAAKPAKDDPDTSETETAEDGKVAQNAAVNRLEPLGPVVDLDPLVVVATRTERASFDAPAIVDVVTRGRDQTRGLAETCAVATEDTQEAIARGLMRSEQVPDARRRGLGTAQRASVWGWPSGSPVVGKNANSTRSDLRATPSSPSTSRF